MRKEEKLTSEKKKIEIIKKSSRTLERKKMENYFKNKKVKTDLRDKPDAYRTPRIKTRREGRGALLNFLPPRGFSVCQVVST